MLERYNPKTCTFFTPVGEMRFALHKMYEVSSLSTGDIPYEKYILGTEELHLMKNAPLVYETYWKYCHFHICAQTTGLRAVGIKKMS